MGFDFGLVPTQSSTCDFWFCQSRENSVWVEADLPVKAAYQCAGFRHTWFAGSLVGMPNARTQCPYCNSPEVIDLAAVLRIPDVDLFQCHTCRELWHVPTDQNWPPSRDLLRLKKVEGA